MIRSSFASRNRRIARSTFKLLSESSCIIAPIKSYGTMDTQSMGNHPSRYFRTMVGWSVTIRLSLVWYGKKKLNPMSMRNPRSTIRLITNRASMVMDSPSPSSMNATSYGVNVAVNNRNVPTSASQYIIRALRGFRSQGFFWLKRPNEVGNPNRAFSSSSSAFRIFSSRSERCGSKSSTGPWYANDWEGPRRDLTPFAFPFRAKSRTPSSSSVTLDASLPGAYSLAPRSRTSDKLELRFC